MENETQKVVIIDDEPTTLLLLESAIEPLAEVVAVTRSLDAFSVIKAQQPDLVILDISMPELSGFDVCKQLKSSSETSAIPVIFITSHSDSDNEHIALSLGAIDFISKPIDIELCRMRARNHLTIQHQKSMLARVNFELEAEKKHLAITLNSIADGVISINAAGEVTFINPVAQRLTGFNEAEAIGTPIDEVMNLRDASTNARLLNPALYALEVMRPVAMSFNATLVSKHNQVFRVEDSASPILDENGRLSGAVMVFQDVSEAIEMAVKMTHLTNHDQLTGLPNRVLLHDRLVNAISGSFSNKQSIALLLIDIDNFKYLNDSLGHQVGDYVIATTAKRLTSVLGTNATLARVGGDEFACLLPDIGSGYSADSIAMACLRAGREPIEIDGTPHQLSFSIGISLYPQDAVNAEEMMRHADSAMYRSKSKGKDTFSFFSKDLQHAMHHRVEMEIKLRQAIENNTLAIYLQPKYDFEKRMVMSAESLVRLFDENGKVIGPDEFIPLAEETGLIHQLGKQVLQKSCEFVAQCNKQGQTFKIAVNVAAKQLSNPGFAYEVEDIIKEAGIDASSIELEVTESALMHDFEQTRDILYALTDLGVTIALDDFGTGYSSLSYLRQFPLNVLKIDRSFVIDMDKEQQAHDIVTAIVNMALSLELSIVAEGIETQAHFSALKDLGCHLGQGYFMCRPIMMSDFFTKFISDTEVA
ncbi:EAL domain-containing protein [Alteromonas gracilis]|uniref:two-component system response regulator n=1 Tax=Alteromonas gracilis TaxID=1479524 RepID=UPI003735F509